MNIFHKFQGRFTFCSDALIHRARRYYGNPKAKTNEMETHGEGVEMFVLCDLARVSE